MAKEKPSPPPKPTPPSKPAPAKDYRGSVPSAPKVPPPPPPKKGK